MTRYLDAKYPARTRRRAPEGYVIRASGGQPEKLPTIVRKEDRRCCSALRDDLGRMQPGFCGPDCEGRRR